MTARGRSNALPPLLPAARRSRRRTGSFALRDRQAVVLSANSEDSDFDAAVALSAAVRERCGLELAVESHVHTRALGPHVALERNGREGEAYRLEVREAGVRLLGSGPAGLRYAVETLCQLVGPTGRIPCCEIDDSPSFGVRGILLDISRGKVPTPDTLRSLVDLCLRLKLNALMLYTEHSFRFRRHPEIGAGTSALDARSLRELDRYAAERFVELIPCLQSLGHMERILGLPAHAHLAESELGWTISPAAPGTYSLLQDLYEEYLPNFRSRRFNANCDEPWDLERGKSAARGRELGPGGVYLEHVARIQRLAAALGKQTLIWADVAHAHPQRLPELDRKLVLLDWGYEADVDIGRARRLAECGLKFWVCPGTSSWNALFPRIDVSLENITRWADAGRRFGAQGLLTTDWGDGGHYNLQGNSWFGYAWSAQQSWSGAVEPRLFDRAFSSLLFADRSGEIARLYRALGRIHDPGFERPNCSALQLLFFDDLERSESISAAKAPALQRCLRSLLRVRERIERAKPRFIRERLTFEELLYAADASLLAIRKAQAGRCYNQWRREPACLGAAERRVLARRLETLAREQSRLVPRLKRLWLARSAPSNFDWTRRRIARSAAQLRAAARRLQRNRPPAPPARLVDPKGDE